MKYLRATPDILGGVLCIRGTRIPIDEVLSQLQQGDSIAEICVRYHWVDPTTIQGAITEALGEAMALLAAKYHG